MRPRLCGHWPDLLPSCLCLNSLEETESVSFLSAEEATAQSLVFVASTGLCLLPHCLQWAVHRHTQWAGASASSLPGRLLFGLADEEQSLSPGSWVSAGEKVTHHTGPQP